MNIYTDTDILSQKHDEKKRKMKREEKTMKLKLEIFSVKSE